jgi:hypothetical protein
VTEYSSIPFGEDRAGEMTGEPVADVAADVAADVEAEAPAGTAAEPAGPGRPQAGDDPADRPWTPIPRQAHALERSLIPGQRRLKKTSRSA